MFISHEAAAGNCEQNATYEGQPSTPGATTLVAGTAG